MADKWKREDDEPMTGIGDEQVRGVADEDDEFEDMDADADDLDDEEDEEGATF